MISICVPVYNFKVDRLVEKLYIQSKLLDVPSEIVLIDDCSEKKIKEHNRVTWEKVKYIQLEKNIGRASIRNLFLKYSNYDYLLFLDCDSIVVNNNFISNYVNAIKAHSNSVICGGREYDQKTPLKNKRLRWKYGIKKESKPVEVRTRQPAKSFMTNNFVISRKIFQIVQFDERLAEYGHEDTLFGFQLKEKGFNIIHINNPVLNGHLEDNIEYIQNTEKAISNLAFILKHTGFNKNLIDNVTILRVYYKLHSVKKAISVIFWMLGPLIKFCLSKGFISLYLFDFYKLGILNKKLTSFNNV